MVLLTIENAKWVSKGQTILHRKDIHMLLMVLRSLISMFNHKFLIFHMCLSSLEGSLGFSKETASGKNSTFKNIHYYPNTSMEAPALGQGVGVEGGKCQMYVALTLR